MFVENCFYATIRVNVSFGSRKFIRLNAPKNAIPNFVCFRCKISSYKFIWWHLEEIEENERERKEKAISISQRILVDGMKFIQFYSIESSNFCIRCGPFFPFKFTAFIFIDRFSFFLPNAWRSMKTDEPWEEYNLELVIWTLGPTHSCPHLLLIFFLLSCVSNCHVFALFPC